MSSISVHSRQAEPKGIDWARLIPGEAPALSRGGKKPQQSVRPFAVHAARPPALNSTSGAVGLLVPRPMQSREAWNWMRSMGADCALIALNWLVVGAFLVPLRMLVPRIRLFDFAAGAPRSLLGIAILHAALITLVGYTEGLHSGNRNLRSQTWILGKSVIWATVVMCSANWLQGASWATSVLFCAAGGLHFAVLCARRWWSEERELSSRLSSGARNVLIVGASKVGRRVASYVERHPASGRRVCGFLDDEKPLGNGVIGRVSDLARMARTAFVDEVILAAPHDGNLARQVFSEAQRLHLDLEIVPELFGCTPAEATMEPVGDLPVICLRAERLPAAGLVVKRIIDVLGAALALIVAFPLLLLMAALIKLDSPGPVLYCAQRAGRKGQLFLCYKFRTMVDHADELKGPLRQKNERSGPIFKIADDPRITRLGRCLRRYSLDELPQLWNVLKGDMSLVGPRPHPVDDVAAYEIEHLARLDMTPGMTGLWQVMARRDSSFRRGMELDREYIRTWNLGVDLRILLRTLLVVLQGGGD